MAKQRYINTKFWSDNWISNLDPIEKLLYLYLLTNERTTIAGIYELPIKIMAVETGIEKDMVEKILKRFEKDDKIVYLSGWIGIKNFTKHQDLNNEKIKKGIEIATNIAPRKVIDRLSIPHTYPPNYSNTNTNTNTNSMETQSVSGKQINDLVKLFEPINPSYEKLYKNTSQRAALERLVKKWGYEKTENLVKALPQIISRKYAPRITTPYQLEDKLGELKIFYEQERGGKNKSKVAIIK
jgi:hypothetical protein